MRKLVFKDSMALARIMRKGNIKAELAAIAEKFTGENVSLEKVGMEAMMTIIEACGSEEVEKEIYSFLAGIFEKSSTDVANMSLEALTKSLKQLAEENNLIHFFKLAGRWNQTKS